MVVLASEFLARKIRLPTRLLVKPINFLFIIVGFLKELLIVGFLKELLATKILNVFDLLQFNTLSLKIARKILNVTIFFLH